MLSVTPCPVEHLFVLIKIDTSYILVSNVYFPPRSDVDNYVIHFDIFSKLLSSLPYVKNIIMIGDYNLPNLHWLPSSIGFSPSLSNLSLTESEFLSKLSYLNIFQFNNILNNNGSILDLILSDVIDVSVNKSDYPLVPCDSYHPGLLISFPVTINKPIDYNLCTYNFYNCNYSDINFTLASVNWCILFSNLCINEAVDIFYFIIY